MSIQLFNIPIDHVSPRQLDAVLRGWICGYQQKMIVTPNPEMLLAARRDPMLHAVLCESHLSLPDGVGLCYAAAATGQSIRFRHTGVDTLLHLAAACEDLGKRLVLFGGDPGSARKAALELRKQFSHLDVVGMDPGFVEEGIDGFLEVSPDVIDRLQAERADVLAVALGAGKQERFIVQHLPRLRDVKIAIGVGGALEMYAGTLKRAPEAFRRAGLEWLWRLFLEPKRVRRIWRATMVFPVLVAYDSVRNKTFFAACRRVVPEVLRQLTRSKL